MLFISAAFSVSVYAIDLVDPTYGHVLPDIESFWDSDKYPYGIVMRRPSYSNQFMFFCSNQPFYYGQYVSGCICAQDGSLSQWWSYVVSEGCWKKSSYDRVNQDFYASCVLWSNHDILDYNTREPAYSVPVPPCPNTDANCDNICDECGQLLPMEYWSTDLEYLITAGYDIVDQTDADYFCILYNSKDLAPELIVGETKFEINSTGDVLLTKNPTLYKLFEWEDGSFSHYSYEDVSKTSDGLYIDPLEHEVLRVLYANHSVENRYVYTPKYDPFGGGETVGGGADRVQADRFDIDLDTYEPIGGLPADPEYGSGRVDVVVSPSAPPVSVPISPTSPVVTPTPDPVPVVTPTPDPSDPNSIIIQNQITNIGNDLAALPDKVGEKITDKIGDSIKGLFVPSETDIRAVKEKWSLLLSDRFGAVYESASVIDGIIDAFVYEGDMETITFPSVTVDLAGTPFTFGGWEVDVVPERFRFLTTTSKLITSIVCTVLFVNGMKKKLEGLLAR